MNAQQMLPGAGFNPKNHWLSDDCCLRRDGRLSTIILAGKPLFLFDESNKADRRFAAAFLGNSGFAKPGPLSKVLNVPPASLFRDRKRLAAGGIAALILTKKGPKGPSKAFGPVLERIWELQNSGLSVRAIAARLGVSKSTVQRACAQAAMPAGEDDGVQVLPFEETDVDEDSCSTTASVSTADDTSADSVAVVSESTKDMEGRIEGPDITSPVQPSGALSGHVTGGSQGGVAKADTPAVAALYAMLGFSPDGEAEVVLESGTQVPFLGVLLALPLLAETGLMAAARKVYGRLSQGIYGLRATMQVLFVMALLRSPRPEALKGKDPRALGDVLGLERAPEVKTVRRKLSEIATLGKAHELLRELGQQWLRDRDQDDVLGVLYVDGHVRVYHGQRELPKAHVTQRNQALPATTDYWVNDVQGEPVFVMTAKANEAMTKVLPVLLAEVKNLGGGRTGTVVFDRGGWSIRLFHTLIEAGWDILTYRKGKHRSHPRKGFVEYKMDIDGREVTLNLSVRTVWLGKGKGKRLKLREIAELRDDGGQTIIVTSHFEQPIVLLAHRMFERWRQENYFRYMKENFELDALVDYDFENDDPVRDVPNPAYKAMTKKLQEARAELAEREQVYGKAAIDNVEAQRPTTRGFKIANAELGKSLKAARDRVEKLVARRKSLPKRVPIGSVLGDEKVIRLSRERKLFTDAIKAAAYRAESALLRLLRPHFRRSEDEGRAFLRDTMLLPGDLLVDGNDVLVRLAPKSAPRYTEALRGLCQELNKLDLKFPETAYSLRYAVAGSPEDR